MYIIENISIKEYYELQDSSDYDIFIETINGKNEFNGRRCSISTLTFDEVEVIKNIFLSANMDNIQMLFIELFKLGSYECSAVNEFLNASIFDLFRAKKHIQDYIIKVIETENTQLAGIPDDKLIMVKAGERLKAVSHLLTKMRLAEQFSTTPIDIGKWNYNTVFTILIANKRSNDVQRDYQNIK